MGVDGWNGGGGYFVSDGLRALVLCGIYLRVILVLSVCAVDC